MHTQQSTLAEWANETTKVQWSGGWCSNALCSASDRLKKAWPSTAAKIVTSLNAWFCHWTSTSIAERTGLLQPYSFSTKISFSHRTCADIFHIPVSSIDSSPVAMGNERQLAFTTGSRSFDPTCRLPGHSSLHSVQ